jgi:hypothetical protein
MFDSHIEEIRAECFDLSIHFGFHLIIMPEVFPFEVLLQWSNEVEAARSKAQASGGWARYSQLN